MLKEQKDILRFFTAGSVDDGKSTLIGRLLCDSRQIYEDHLEGLKRDSAKRGWENGTLDYSLLLDGLKAEREQNITIDVAYRYFSTPKRKFIVADTPGHEQYTPNMATGASTAHLLLLLINAKNGIVQQTRRHSFIASLMGIKHIVVVINKMDLVEYSEKVFEQIKREYIEFSARLSIHDVYFIPLSASKGDNVVEPSAHMPWFCGKPLLQHLEDVHIAGERNQVDLRFPVQLVLRPHADFRGYAGTISSGILRKGDEVMALPSGQKSRIRSIYKYKEELNEACASQAVTVQLEHDIDVSRGDMIVHIRNQPKARMHLEAMLIWMDSEKKGKQGNTYLLKHSTRWVPAILNEIVYKIDVNTLHRQKDSEQTHSQIEFNEIGRVFFTLQRPIFADIYESNRSNGCFILIDSLTNQTVAAGIIIDRESSTEDNRAQPSMLRTRDIPEIKQVNTFQEDRQRNHKGAVIWLTGLSGSGKSTIAYSLEERLLEAGLPAYVLDGDALRKGLNKDLGFSREDRAENVRRIGEVAALFARAGMVVIAALISPYQKDRDIARNTVPEGCFFEIFLNTPFEVCKNRDPKGLYKKALAGDLQGFTGVNDPYESPLNPDLILDTSEINLEAAVDKIMRLVQFKV